MSDIDNALRTMLRERATDITTLPTRFDDLSSLDAVAGLAHRPNHRTHWATFAAAAAVVVGIASVTVALRDRDTHHSQPVRPVTPVTPPVTPRVTPPVTPPVTACTTTLPAAWTPAASTLGATSAIAIAVSSTGSVLATRDFGDKRDVVIVERGSAPRSIFTVPDPDQKTVDNGSLEGKWALVPVLRVPRNANGVIGTVAAIVLVDTTNGRTRTIETVTDAEHQAGHRTIDGAILRDGHVYWDLRPSYASQAGTVLDYEIATGQRRTIFSGQVSAPEADVVRVFWGDGSAASSAPAPEPLPPVVAAATRPARSRATLSTDGSYYAWVDSKTRIGWWAPGAAAPTYVTLPADAAPGDDPSAGVIVAGPYVYLNGETTDGSYFVLDMRTRALAKTAALLRFSGGGVFAGYRDAGGPKADPIATFVLDTATLPGLHC
ncbi:MAG: hypothetical protein ABI808_06360 [Pseudonocardiales bacterium]